MCFYFIKSACICFGLCLRTCSLKYGRQKRTLGVRLRNTPHLLCDRILAWSLLIRLNLLASELQESLCFDVLSTEITMSAILYGF